MNCAIIGSDNGLLPVWCQVITSTNANMLSIALISANFNENAKYNLFLTKNALDYDICEMPAI